MFNPRLFATLILLILLLAGCAPSAESCPSFSPVDRSGAEMFARDDNLPFRFPLDGRVYAAPFSTNFAAYGQVSRSMGQSGPEYHAAEDSLQPAGTPVYAMADGQVSFSGPMQGHGWLIIIDHPLANLYSLYGHLSPSRWQVEPGPVAKGELIGFLGDSDENGGSAEHPLRTHLHFGVRAGQRSDYPGMGQWRWQAGWTRPCPQDLGWLQPAIRRNKPFVLVLNGVLLMTAGWISHSKGTRLSYALLAMSVLLLAIGIYEIVRRSSGVPRTQS
jgi:hypothetical protein